MDVGESTEIPTLKILRRTVDRTHRNVERMMLNAGRLPFRVVQAHLNVIRFMRHVEAQKFNVVRAYLNVD